MRFWLISLGIVGLALYLLSNILLPFVAGMAIAYFFDPLADRLEERGLGRGFAAASIIIGFLTALVVGGILLAPVLEDQILEFIQDLPDYINRSWAAFSPLYDRLIAALPLGAEANVGQTASSAAERVMAWSGNLVGGVWKGAGNFFNLLGLILITPVVAFFLLRDWDYIVAKIDKWLPRDHAEVIRQQVKLADRALAGFARGQATVCMILGTCYAIGWSLVGLEFGLVIGLVTGLLAFVPYAGAFLGLIVALAIAFGQFLPDYTSIALVVLVFAVVQTVDASFITPRLLGRHVGLHPVWILFALLTGGALFGFVGVLVAVPTAAVVGVLVRFAIDQYLESRVFLGRGGREDGGGGS